MSMRPRRCLTVIWGTYGSSSRAVGRRSAPAGHHVHLQITDQHPTTGGHVDRIIGLGQEKNVDQVNQLRLIAVLDKGEHLRPPPPGLDGGLPSRTFSRPHRVISCLVRTFPTSFGPTLCLPITPR